MDVTTQQETTLWLPPWPALRGQLRPDMALWQIACRADRLALEAGADARVTRAFDVLPRGIPVAPLTRQLDAGDAMGYTWLRADPASMRPDMASARLLSCGAELALSADEAEALLRPLQPLFGDEGFPISAPLPGRWYLCLPAEAKLPAFAPPEVVFGDDLFAHLPEGDAGRRWRRLLNEAQVILHHHPVNRIRIHAGRLPVNSLWFWGGGRLPQHVRARHPWVFSDDVLIRALCLAAGSTCRTADPSTVGAQATAGSGAMQAMALHDLRDRLDAVELDRHWLAPLLETLGRGSLLLDFGDGMALRWQHRQRWRVWRRRLPA